MRQLIRLAFQFGVGQRFLAADDGRPPGMQIGLTLEKLVQQFRPGKRGVVRLAAKAVQQIPLAGRKQRKLADGKMPVAFDAGKDRPKAFLGEHRTAFRTAVGKRRRERLVADDLQGDRNPFGIRRIGRRFLRRIPTEFHLAIRFQ